MPPDAELCRTDLLMLLQEPQGFADDLAGGGVAPATDFLLNEALQFRG
jgi:hypothetical protein